MKRELTEIDIDNIRTKSSLRDGHVDTSSLEASIGRIGLLHPLVVDKNNVLISGQRRLIACRNAGIARVPALRLDVEFDSMEARDIQSDENLCRQALTPEEVEKQIQTKKKLATRGDAGGPAKLLGGLKRLFVESAPALAITE